MTIVIISLHCILKYKNGNVVNIWYWNVQLKIALSFFQSSLSAKFLREEYLSIDMGWIPWIYWINLKLSYVFFLISKRRFIKVNFKRPACFIITCCLQHELAMKWKGQLSESHPILPQTSKMEDFATIING